MIPFVIGYGLVGVGIIGLVGVLLFAKLPDKPHPGTPTAPDTPDTPAPSLAQHRAVDLSDSDATILGRRPENDAVFGSWPLLRVPDRLPPSTDDPTGPGAST